MIFSNKHPGAIYIQKKTLDFHVEGEEKHLELPADTVSDGDIINPAKYEKIIEDFITAENVKKQQFILVLSEEILFKKTIPLEDIKLLDERLTDFVSMIPVESEKLAKKSVELDNNIELFAVNKELFEKIIEILSRSGFEVLAVVPLAPYSNDRELNEEVIKKIYQDKQFLRKVNFLSGAAYENHGWNNKIMAIIIFLSIVILILSFLLINNSKETKVVQVKPTTIPIPIATESASPKNATESAFLSKRDQLRVNILNGTDIAGQAAKVKDLLIGLGLSKIETDNAEGAKAKETVVIFSSQVADDLQEEIITLLKNSFDSISTQKNISSQSADILITTGSPKN